MVIRREGFINVKSFNSYKGMFCKTNYQGNSRYCHFRSTIFYFPQIEEDFEINNKTVNKFNIFVINKIGKR